MISDLDTLEAGPETPGPASVPSDRAEPAVRETCAHCGLPCATSAFNAAGKSFCCPGCRGVFEILQASGLENFYTLGGAGLRVPESPGRAQFTCLDEPEVSEKMLDFTDARVARVTFRTPAIHCIACVWLLENLYRLAPGVGNSRVNLPRQEVAITFEPARIKLSELAALLASLGYEPELRLADLENQGRPPVSRRLWLQLAVAGFAFGNIMLFSLPAYLGLDSFSGPSFRRLFGYFSLVLALPVVLYSAGDYWRSAWIGLRQRVLTIETPIAAGLAALFGQSAYEVISGRGEGYFDSLAGLLFFLLCGKLFQQKTYDRLVFDRDYKSFFPLSVIRKLDGREERAPLSRLAPGDTLVIRHGELIPADARLASGAGVIDYSFVTGEAEPVEKKPGEHLYAGGRQIGGLIEIRLRKTVSQSYLASLWDQEAFRKGGHERRPSLTNRFSQRFTWIILAIALGAGAYWAAVEPAKAVKAFTSVLIVACPCALALAAPFTLGTAQRLLGRHQIFLKHPRVLETLARVDTVVFDKTGTLTSAGAVTWQGEPLTTAEVLALHSMARQSTHPLAARIRDAFLPREAAVAVAAFLETAGRGIEGRVSGQEIWMGSAAWLASRGAPGPASGPAAEPRGGVHVALDGSYRGYFALTGVLRPGTEALVAGLAPEYQLELLSGDNELERARFTALLGPRAGLHFNQTPPEKLVFVRQLQAAGKTVLMAGDGLNDAGALKQSDAGVAVVEEIGAFSPASDVIMAATMLSRLPAILRFAKDTTRVVRWGFRISSLYNVAGVAIAATGNLSPVVCAILMPLSSVTVVAFACGATHWLGRRGGLSDEPEGSVA